MKKSKEQLLQEQNTVLKKQLEQEKHESKIEAALEKLRRKAMKMRKSEELISVATVLQKELMKLGVTRFVSCGFSLIDEKNKTQKLWGSRTNTNLLEESEIPLLGDSILKARYEAWKRKEAVFSQRLGAQELKKHLDVTFPVKKRTRAEKIALKDMPDPTFFYFGNFSYGYIMVFATAKLTENETALLPRFASVFEMTYRRFLDLQKAETQTREAQIEAALERVRSSAMAMHSSKDLQKVAEELRRQIGQLDYKDLETCAIHLYDESPDYFVSWAAQLSPDSQSDILLSNVHFPKSGVEIFDEMLEAYYSGKKDYVIINEGKKMTGFLKMLKQYAPQAHQVVLNTFKDFKPKDFRSFWTISDFVGGSLLISTLTQPDVLTRDLLRRFANVFGLAYRRFTDLQKAEAQAREAEIQLALERVRARTMAMHYSIELGEVAVFLHRELRALGTTPFLSCGYVEVDLQKKKQRTWMTSTLGKEMEEAGLPLTGDPVLNKRFKSWKKQDPLFHQTIHGDALQKHFEFVIPFLNSSEREEMIKTEFPPTVNFYCANFPNGYLHILSESPLKSDEEELLVRFTKVFQMTYNRFLDLQKAEAQAREAQIEAALERIRAQSMAMHKSEELVQVVKLIDKEIAGLGIMVDNSNIITDISEPGQGVNNWIAIKGQNYLEKFHIPYLEHPVTTKFYHAIKKGVNYYCDKYSKSDKDKYFKLLFKYSDFRRAPKKRQQFIFSAPGWTRAIVLSKNSALMFQRHNITDFTVEEEEIFKRFGKVFDQAYTRFLDLQKAEEQARQAQIEAALERVRARSMGMHKSNELKDVVRLLYKEFRVLVTDPHSVNIQLKLDSSNDIYYWASVEEDIYQELYHLRDTGLPLLEKIHNAFTAPGEGFVDYLLNKEEKDAFFSGIFKIQPVPPHRKKMIQNAEGMVMMGWFHKHSGIDIMRYNLNRFSEQEKDIVKRFAATFEQTYIRFLDLQKAEAQAREARIEAALERVRSRSMAMHESKDLHGVVTLVYEQLESIGLFMNSVLLHELTYDSKSQHFWVAANGQVYPEQTEIPITKNAFFTGFKAAKENNESFFVQRLSKQQKDNFFKHYFGQSSHSDVPQDRKDYIFSCDGLNRSTALHEYTALTILRYDKIAYSPEQNEVIRRFAQVFEQSYRRYLDLKKAEEQAREAEIQLALERVRARTMAMYNSDELAETAAILFQQMTALGVTPERLNICLINEAEKILEVWATDQEGTKISHHFNASLDEPTTVKRVYDAWKEKKKSIIIDLSGKELNDWIRYVREVMGMLIKAELVREHRIHSVSFFSQGLILNHYF